MQIESLHYFIALARAGSFYRAAKNVYISQQGLSKAVGAIETELGVQLVTRNSRGIRLTSAGEAFLAYAEKMVALHNELIDSLVSSDTAEDRAIDPLVVRATYYPIQIAAGIREGSLFSDKLTIDEVRFNDILDMAETCDGGQMLVVDLFPYSHHLVEDRRSLVFEPLLTTRYGIIWREDSPPAAGEMLHRDDIARLPLALNSQRDMAKLNEWLFREHPLRNVPLRAASPRLLLEYVQAAPGRFAGFDSFGFHLSQRDSGMATDGVRFTPLSTPEGICQVGVLYNKHHRPFIRVRHAIDRLKAMLRKDYAAYFGTPEYAAMEEQFPATG